MDNKILEDVIMKEEKKPENKLVSGVYDIVSIFMTAVITIMVIFTFVFRFVGVVGPSMMDTLNDGDWLLVSAISGEPEYGDVVIVTQENYYHEPIVKRVIATENQVVDIVDNTVYVDGKALEEPYAKGITEAFKDSDAIQFPTTVPENCVFVLGDNRQHSSDSRSTKIGFIDENYILGKVKYRVFPFGDFKVE